MPKKFLVLDVPVLHQGYINLFRKYAGEVWGIFLFGERFVEEAVYLIKEIRAIDPQTMKNLIEALGFFARVEVMENQIPAELQGAFIITTNDRLTKRLVVKYFKDNPIFTDSAFLRWDEGHVMSEIPVNYDRVSTDAFDRKIIEFAEAEGRKSPDWWRQVGAILVRDGKMVLEAHNLEVISDHYPYAFGNIRDFIKAGEKREISPTLHAEKALAVEAANKGVPLKGSSIYLTCFPCVDCAKVIAYGEMKACYFSGGSSNLDGVQILKSRGVELVLVR